MNIRDLVRQEVVKKLHSWEGFPVLWNLLAETPRLRIYLAGGAIRNVVAGGRKKSKDFDFFVEGITLPHLIAALNRHGSVTFGPFGSPRWTPHGHPATYADVVHIRHFNNGVGPCANIEDVLHQFDFTANAIALNVRDGTLLDPLGGITDMRKGIMRAIRFDYPDERISPHHSITRLGVLWFRLMHYASLHAMTIEPRTLSWLRKNRAAYLPFLPEFSRTFFRPKIPKTAYAK